MQRRLRRISESGGVVVVVGEGGGQRDPFIVSLNDTSLAEDILMYIRCVQNDDFLHLTISEIECEAVGEHNGQAVPVRMAVLWSTIDHEGRRLGPLRWTRDRCQSPSAGHVFQIQAQRYHRRQSLSMVLV